mgnify:CR=1 FL=1
MFKGKLKNKLAVFATSAVMAVSSVAGVVPSAMADSDLGLDNYAKLLQYSLYFYDANYCGIGAGEKSHIAWRDDCHTENIANGGFHDAGDGIICGLTEGFTASTLGWLYYEYKDEFQKTGTYAHLKDITNEFAQFFKNCTTLDADGNVTNFIYEIGDDGIDHGKWRAPELMPQRGSNEYYSTTNGASNVAAQYAAALAQNYINFGNEEDLNYAKALYAFAAKYRTMTYEQSTYTDKSVEDDIAWAAGWLYLATNEQPYLDANSKDTSTTNDWVNDYYYGGVWLGAAIINAEITGNWDKPVNYIQSVVNSNQNKFYVMNSWGSARHNTLMQTCAMIATKHKEDSGADFSEWCKGQMDMILGKNNANVCLVVGYNDVSATSPHHRAASGLYVGDGWEEWGSWNGDYASVPTSHTLYGALCGGPTSEDFSTFRKLDAKDATSNEVALDYQVGLVGAAVGLYNAYGTGSVVDTIGDDVTVYPEEIAVANGQSTTETTTTTTTTQTTTQTTTSTDTETVTTTTTTGSEQETVTFVDCITEIGDNTVTFQINGTFTVSKAEDMEKIKAIGTGKNVNINFLKSNNTIMEIYSINVMGTGDVLYGDVNVDGEVSIADAVLIMQSLANADEYSISEQGKLNADVIDNDGITAKDALVIQMVMADTLNESDLPTTSEKIGKAIFN